MNLRYHICAPRSPSPPNEHRAISGDLALVVNTDEQRSLTIIQLLVETVAP